MDWNQDCSTLDRVYVVVNVIASTTSRTELYARHDTFSPFELRVPNPKA
jgi:hypothetical protein